MQPKIAFFDIDGTLTRETDGRVPDSAVQAIRAARQNGHRMFLCSGRCLFDIEPRFTDIGFDGIVAGCGTHVLLSDGTVLFHRSLGPKVTRELVLAGREAKVDLLFESAAFLSYDPTRPLTHPISLREFPLLAARGVNALLNVDAPDFNADKMCVFSDDPEKTEKFLRVSEKYLDTVDRGEGMYELVPHGCSKATGIREVMAYYSLPADSAFAFGDSMNDLPMLTYVKNSVVMGNAQPESLKDIAFYVAPRASEDGIAVALRQLGFI